MIILSSIIEDLYFLEIDRAHLDFDGDPEYQTYLAQSELLWQDPDMPEPIFRLLDRANLLSFAHGFRLALELAGRESAAGLKSSNF